MASHKLLILSVCAAAYLCSCSSPIEGKIEERENNKMYLVNKSKTKALQFTIKKTTITNDSAYDYETCLVPLAPGSEIYLGPRKAVEPTRYQNKGISIFKTHYEKHPTRKTVPPNTDPENAAFIKAFEESVNPSYEKLNDTIIKGEKLKYEYVVESVPDSLNPLPGKRYSYKYEVTGQSPSKIETVSFKP